MLALCPSVHPSIRSGRTCDVEFPAGSCVNNFPRTSFAHAGAEVYPRRGRNYGTLFLRKSREFVSEIRGREEKKTFSRGDKFFRRGIESSSRKQNRAFSGSLSPRTSSIRTPRNALSRSKPLPSVERRPRSRVQCCTTQTSSREHER